MYRIIKGHIDQRSTKRKWNFASDKFRITRVFPIVQASMDAASAFGPKVARLQEYTVPTLECTALILFRESARQGIKSSTNLFRGKGRCTKPPCFYYVF